MTRILVTGGNSGLGREVVARLPKAGYTVRVMSRQPRPANLPADVEWATADLESGAGLEEAVLGVEAVVHAASNPVKHTRETDVEGTRRLIEASRSIRLQHFIHISIVGIEKIHYPYYRAKLDGEAVVRGGGLPYTILRATQFHTLIDGWLLAPYRNLSFGFVPTDFKFQSIETGEVAERVVQLLGQSPAGLLPDMGGPEVLTLGEMAKQWNAARGKRFWALPMYVPGALANGFRNGHNTCPDHRDGRITWTQWLEKKYQVLPKPRGA
jgi:uncharacterized protein YbjT (DUF2867 family)